MADNDNKLAKPGRNHPAAPSQDNATVPTPRKPRVRISEEHRKAWKRLDAGDKPKP